MPQIVFLSALTVNNLQKVKQTKFLFFSKYFFEISFLYVTPQFVEDNGTIQWASLDKKKLES